VAKSIEYLSKKRSLLVDERAPWDNQFEVLAEYVYQRKMGFQSETSPGDFKNDGSINDSTASRALQAMTSAIMGSLWKTGGRTFRLKQPEYLSKNEDNKKYYEAINKAIYRHMESEKAGFELAFQENLNEEAAFGTGAFGVFQGDYRNPLIFKCWSLQSLRISQSTDEFVDTLYFDEKISVEQVVNTYGLDKVSEATAKKYKEEKSRLDKVLICIAIEPRTNEDKKDAPKAGNKAMPFATYHFEVENKHILKESGYAELPSKVSRWYRLASETYGRSPAMDALPAIMQLNALKEAFIVGVEKKVEPPLYTLDDGSLGAATVDTSAGGLSVFNMSGRMNGQPPIGVIFDVGELQSLTAAIEGFRTEIMQHFLIDKLYDLNNKTRMTLGEAEIRYDIRSDALSSVYSRIFNEQLTPVIERSVNVLFEMGLMGISEADVTKEKILKTNGIDPIFIPEEVQDAILAGKNLYDIEYISPAAQLLRASEKAGVTETINGILALAAINPDAFEYLDLGQAIESIRDLSGAPSKILMAIDVAQANIRSKKEAQMQAMEVEKARLGSETTKNIAGAGKDVAMAGQPV
jgi:hypothetical protein